MVRDWNKAGRGREQNDLQRICQSFKAADWFGLDQENCRENGKKGKRWGQRSKQKKNSLRLREAQANPGINSELIN